MQTAADRDDDRHPIDLDFYFQQRVFKCRPHKRLQHMSLDMRLQYRVFRSAIVETAHAIYPAAYRAVMNALRHRKSHRKSWLDPAQNPRPSFPRSRSFVPATR